MSALWPHWERPLWLLALPFIALVLWRVWHRERSAGQWHTILPPVFHALLLTGGDQRESRKPWLVLAIAWSLAIVALAGPGWQRLEQPLLRQVDPLVVILDLGTDILSSDLPPTRLQHAKHKVIDLLDARQGAQTAIVVFAGSSHALVPLSDDSATSLNLLDAVEPDLMPEPGHRADLAVAQALKLLDHGARGHGQLLLLTTALDDRERDGIRRAMAGRRNGLKILGFGTAQGAPIVQKDGGLLRDAQGAILLPRLDAGALEAFSASVGGAYATARLDESDLLALHIYGGTSAAETHADVRRFSVWQDHGHWLLIPLLILAALAGRRGWLFVLPLMLALPQPVMALEWRDLWWRADQQGQRLLAQDRPDEAAKRFEDRQWQAISLYNAGDYAGAAERFARGQTAEDRYNLGNALAQDEKYEAAIDAYDQALQLAPDLSQAKTNKALVEALLKQREQQQAGPDTLDPDEKKSNASTPNSESSPAAEHDAGLEQDNAGGAPLGKHPDGQGLADKGAETPGEGQSQDVPQSTADHLHEDERRQALEQWLRQIPDNPAELLRRKFWYEQQQRQEISP
jgi:Ca-activated chloride channel family protein